MIWVAKHPRATPDMLGYLPTIITDTDSRPAKVQINDRYRHGGGWNRFHGHTMLPNGDLSYPGDPPTHLLYEAKLHDEIIRFYEHSWVAIIQPDGSHEISRMD